MPYEYEYEVIPFADPSRTLLELACQASVPAGRVGNRSNRERLRPHHRANGWAAAVTAHRALHRIP